VEHPEGEGRGGVGSFPGRPKTLITPALFSQPPPVRREKRGRFSQSSRPVACRIRPRGVDEPARSSQHLLRPSGPVAGGAVGLPAPRWFKLSKSLCYPSRRDLPADGIGIIHPAQRKKSTLKTTESRKTSTVGFRPRPRTKSVGSRRDRPCRGRVRRGSGGGFTWRREDSPQGRTDFPRGRTDSPQGKLDLPQGEVSSPQGKLDSPQGEIDSPQGKLDFPPGELDLPQGEIDSPEGRKDRPRGEPGFQERPDSG